jgi:hypothetical protein
VVGTLPVPIEFSLPEGWRSVPPDQVDTPEAAFVALHTGLVGSGFTPNITITGEVVGDDVPLTVIADQAVERLRATDPGEVRLGRRSEVGSAENPGLTQAVKLTTNLRGGLGELVQFQVFLGMADRRQPGRRAVLHIVLTSLLEQFPQVINDFQQFIATIQPESAR